MNHGLDFLFLLASYLCLGLLCFDLFFLFLDVTLKSGGVNFIGEGYLSDGPPQFNVVAVLFILTFFYFFLFLFRLSLIVVDLVV